MLVHRIYAIELRINSSKYSTIQDIIRFLPWDLWSKIIRQVRPLVGDLFDEMKERGLSFLKLIVSKEHKRKDTESNQRIFDWIKLTDVLCTSDKTSSQESAKKVKRNS